VSINKLSYIHDTSALNNDVARLVALAPDQYQWEYKRFRVQPDGSDIYAKDP
jgi:KDO2-lipid IV(A) lauroyltransferase